MADCRLFEKITTFGSCTATKLQNEMEASQRLYEAQRAALLANKEAEAKAATDNGKLINYALLAVGAAVLALILFKYLKK